jgi:hypothetical protein
MRTTFDRIREDVGDALAGENAEALLTSLLIGAALGGFIAGMLCVLVPAWVISWFL